MLSFVGLRGFSLDVNTNTKNFYFNSNGGRICATPTNNFSCIPEMTSSQKKGAPGVEVIEQIGEAPCAGPGGACEAGHSPAMRTLARNDVCLTPAACLTCCLGLREKVGESVARLVLSKRPVFLLQAFSPPSFISCSSSHQRLAIETQRRGCAKP